MTEGNWVINPTDNSFVPTDQELFSVFPTIVEPKKQIVYCRRCHRWEYIARFSNNKLLTQCGQVYGAPFTMENSLVHFGYNVKKHDNNYYFLVKSQLAKLNDHRIIDSEYYMDMKRKVLYKNGKPIYENADFNVPLCKEITQECLDDMGDSYKKEYGIKPSVASQFKGFKLLLGYMLCPFNINFFAISKHWGLNPYDHGFTYLSSGNTPSAENEMFDCLGIKPTKKIRKMYQAVPQSVICYAAAHDLGFNDVNILQKSYSSEFYTFLSFHMISFVGGDISYPIRDGLKTFVEDLLPLSSEKTIWNTIQKTVKYFIESPQSDIYITDALNIYMGIHEYLTNNDKMDILHEGFNRYTHDFLNRRSEEFRVDKKVSTVQENIVFPLEDEFLRLEYKCGNDMERIKNPKTGEYEYVPVKDYDRFCFYVARDSRKLVEIGEKMHNCVGYGYKKAVNERRATIVYAEYKGKMRICIEVSPDFSIRQSLGPCNHSLQGDELDAYKEWCEKKNIVFIKAFSIHVAP